MSAQALLFWAIALWTVATGILVVVSRNVLRAALGLAGCFVGVAGLYFFLEADFLGAAQILVYVGGIIILFLFAVMFTRIGEAPDPAGGHLRIEASWTNRPLGIVAAVGAFFLAIGLLSRLPPGRPVPLLVEESAEAAPVAAPWMETTREIGEALLTSYLLPFEIISLLLLLVLIGAVILVRKEIREVPEQEAAGSTAPEQGAAGPEVLEQGATGPAAPEQEAAGPEAPEQAAAGPEAPDQEAAGPEAPEQAASGAETPGGAA